MSNSDDEPGDSSGEPREPVTQQITRHQVILDRGLRSIGRVSGIEVEQDLVRIRIIPHREFRRRHPDVTDEQVHVDAEDLDRVQGPNAILGRDVEELIEEWRD